MRSGVVLACAGVDRILFENMVFTWLHKSGQWMISGYRISQLVRGSIFIAPGRPASLYAGAVVFMIVLVSVTPTLRNACHILLAKILM